VIYDQDIRQKINTYNHISYTSANLYDEIIRQSLSSRAIDVARPELENAPIPQLVSLHKEGEISRPDPKLHWNNAKRDT
jgi:hypothetical protein